METGENVGSGGPASQVAWDRLETRHMTSRDRVGFRPSRRLRESQHVPGQVSHVNIPQLLGSQMGPPSLSVLAPPVEWRSS